MEYLKLDTKPDLRSPTAVVAFGGWGDAAEAATGAARRFVRRLGARRFASIAHEPFFDFAVTRPSVRLNVRGERELQWPANEFFYARNPTGDHDFIAAIGVEPNMRWRSFATIYRDLFRELGVSQVISLGALISDVLHDEPARVTGSTGDDDSRRRLDLAVSRYEGPTGISGVLQTMLRDDGMSTASLWANVPHYVSSTQNPPAVIGLLSRLEKLIGVTFDYTELESEAERFVTEVNMAVAASPEIREYIRRVKEAREEERQEDDAGEASAGPGDLPRGSDLVVDVEQFLRERREDN